MKLGLLKLKLLGGHPNKYFNYRKKSQVYRIVKFFTQIKNFS